MIGVRLEGRLGNQLFQYAFVVSTARKLNTNFHLDQTIEPFLLAKYFDVPRNTFYLLDKYIFSIKGFKNIFTHHLRIRFYKIIKSFYNLSELSLSNFNMPSIELEKIKNQTLYQGFFQSENYFKEDQDIVKKHFLIKDKYRSEYNKVVKNFPQYQKLIVIHIRKGDYVQLGLDLPISYFHKAINEIKTPNAFYVFLSDEPDIIQNEFDYISNKYVSRNAEIIDFQFLMNADICVLSNSSFSWWGAYLNSKKPKVIAPKYWLGTADTETPHSIIQSNWAVL